MDNVKELTDLVLNTPSLFVLLAMAPKDFTAETISKIYKAAM